MTASGWQDHGETDWLITSLHLAGRIHPDGQPTSIWWAGRAGVGADLSSYTLQLDGGEGWRGDLIGPGVVAIGVTAVAACHSPEALSVHPGLGCLRRPAAQTETVRAPEPLALESGDRLSDLWENSRLP